jgi:4-amino-4-deoxy-L-arabinose transferase-like glycosyltransferase
VIDSAWSHAVAWVPPRVRALVVPVGLVLLAAALRLPDLATRGTWDGDQGHDMLVLRDLVRDGVVPLLGPPTSIGDVHHGAFYYYLLAPAAALTGGDSPYAVVLWIALMGVAAVLVTWWLAGSIGGPVASLVAGLAMAVSPAAVDESTFIWNPNLIALSSVVALAGAWQAWRLQGPRWWLLAAAGVAVTMQSHVLGVTLLPVVGALLVADVRRRVSPAERRTVVRVGLAGLAVIAATFVPLVIHELTTDFAEVHAALAYLRAGGEPPSQGPLARFVFIEARVVSWPLVGLIVDGVTAAMLSLVGVFAIVVWRSLAARQEDRNERVVARWLGLGLVWTALVLTFASPSLATVVRGLPNDHYHAFADPMVFVLVGLGAAALWRGVPNGAAGAAGGGSATGVAVAASRRSATGVAVGRAIAIAGIVAVVAWAALHQPPSPHPDGGFPGAAAAADRIEGAAGPGPIRLLAIPDFKSVESYAYPLVRGGRTLERGAMISEASLERPGSGVGEPGSLVVICDSLFEPVIGAACGGPAEAIAVPGELGDVIDRFEAAPGRWISVFRGSPP